MKRSTVRSASLAILLTVNGCGHLLSSSSRGTPGLSIAEAALEGGSGQIALQVSEGVLRDSPRDVHALEIKGDALTLLGEYDGATAIFQALLAKDPGSIRANIGLGRIRLTKEPAAAETLFLAVLRREPRNLTALNNLGIARDLLGRHDEAQTAYRQALAVNPDLDSAQVNMALSLAMSGHGPQAVQLLRDKATQPYAPAKIKQDYAMALALSGNRGEAERVLSDSMSPEQAHQMLDNVTGTHTRMARETPKDETSRLALSRGDDADRIPPDVVQVPEGAAPVARVARAGVPGQASGSVQAAAWSRPPAAAQTAAAAPPPMVVRPRPADADSDAPIMQPVNPVAAASTNLRPLSAPVRSGAGIDAATEDAAGAAPAPDLTTVAMPRPVPRAAPVAATEAMPPRAIAASAAPMVRLPALPLPPAFRPPPPFASLPVATPVVTSRAPAAVGTTATQAAPMPHLTREVVAFATPPEPPRHHAAPVSPRDDATETRLDQGEASGAAVQFAATPSEESARAFWQSLAHRFPDVLGHRTPVVMRFEHNGTVFWRVRTGGFATAADAASLCAHMRAIGQPCFVPAS